MKTWLKQLSITSIVTATFSMNVFADQTPAQLDTTPPPPEGALSADQTPPINASGAALSDDSSTPAAPGK